MVGDSDDRSEMVKDDIPETVNMLVYKVDTNKWRFKVWMEEIEEWDDNGEQGYWL